MATKWKKWKSSIGFLAFVISVSLLITGGVGILYQAVEYRGGLSDAMKQVNQTDYQESSSFRNFMSSRLENFLAMACGDFVRYATYDDNSEMYYYRNAVTDVEETVTVEGNYAVEEDYAGYLEADGSLETDEDEISEKQKKEAAESFHDQIKTDKNLLYDISYDGKELYSNMGNITWENDAEKLPEGYNFYLHFNGTKVQAYKDGKEMDIYGDGIYREDEDWYVPGFSNFTGKEKWKKADIVILAAQEPIIYTGVDYGSSSLDWQENELYNLYKNFQIRRENMKYIIACLVFGILFFLLYLRFRKDKQEMDKKIAGMTGKMWFEFRVVLFLLIPILLCFVTVDGDVSGRWYGYVSEWGYTYSDVFDILAEEMMENTVIMLLVVWLVYLFFIDRKQNPKGYQHSLTAKYCSVLGSRNLKLPLSKRMVRRFDGIFFLSLILFAVAVVMCAGIFLAIAAALLAAEYVYQKKNKCLALELEQLAERITIIHDGDYTDTAGFTAKDSDIRQMDKELEEIREGMETAVEERIKSERMKVELVANVSHDIKTPLTSIISYIQLLKQEENLPDYVMDYVRILDEKAERLKNMVQDVFSVSKAASGQLTVELKELDFGKLLYQTLADMEEQIKNSSVMMKTIIPKEPVLVVADGQRMYRVFQNLIGNAIKYSLEGSRVYVTLKEEGELAVASVKNTSSQELDSSIDFAERFTRGDESRTDGGSGLGLSIAKSFTEACGGTFQLEVNADLFVVTVALPKK